MVKTTYKELMPGVYLRTYITDKFKTGSLSVSLLRPLTQAEATVNALFPKVLRLGTETHPDMSAITAALDELYGAAVEPMVRKKGEVQSTGFYCDFIEDKYISGESGLFEKTAKLMGEILLHPVREKEAFCPTFFNGEKEKLVEAILAQKNDKRIYAQNRLVSLMFEGEAFGVDRLGSIESAESITNQELYDGYRNTLLNSRIEVFYCGPLHTDRVERAVMGVMGKIPRLQEPAPVTLIKNDVAQLREITERLDVTQGKLSIGLRNGTTAAMAEYPAAMLFNAVYGGSLTSKLFMNVREKMSLCYYASSAYDKYKGVMLINSGIEFDKYEVARDEILTQLDACKNGEISGDELESAKKHVISTLETGMDSQAFIDDFYLGQSLLKLDYGPEELARQISKVTRDQIVQAANQTQLDTVYFLDGLE